MTSSKTPILWAFSIFAVAVWAIALVFTYHDLPFWVDEGVTILQLSGQMNIPVDTSFQNADSKIALLDGKAGLLNLTGNLYQIDVHPPFYYIMAELWTRVFGGDTLTIRLFSTLLVVSAFLLFIHIDKTNKLSRIVSLPIFFFSPTVLYAAVNARDYGMSLFLVVASFFFIHKVIEQDEQNKPFHAPFIMAVLCTCLAFITHYFTILALLPAMLFLTPKLKRLHHKGWAYSLIIIVLTLPIALPFLANQLGAREDQYAGFLGFVTEGKAALYFLGKQLNSSTQDPFIALSCLIALVSFITLALYSKTSKRARLHTLSIIGFFFLIIALFLGTDKTIDGSNYRYFVFIVPSFVYGIALLLQKTKPIFLPVAGVALLLLGAWPVYTHGVPMNPWYNKNKIADYAEALEMNRELNGKIIVLGNAWGRAEYLQHLQPDDQIAINYYPEPIEALINEAAQGRSLIITTPASWDKTMTPFYEEKTKALEVCGFTQHKTFLWTRETTTPCTGITQ